MAETEEFVDQGKSPKAGKSKKLLASGIVAGIMLAEGAALFFVTKMMYKEPEGAQAAQLTEEQQALRSVQDEVELSLPELNAFNKREGRLFLYSLQITVRVRKDNAPDIETILKARESTIQDRFNTVIRSAETKHLNEPRLDTIRRQFLFELNGILGDDELILELLIPKFFQSPANV